MKQAISHAPMPVETEAVPSTWRYVYRQVCICGWGQDENWLPSIEAAKARYEHHHAHPYGGHKVTGLPVCDECPECVAADPDGDGGCRCASEVRALASLILRRLA